MQKIPNEIIVELTSKARQLESLRDISNRLKSNSSRVDININRIVEVVAGIWLSEDPQRLPELAQRIESIESSLGELVSSIQAFEADYEKSVELLNSSKEFINSLLPEPPEEPEESGDSVNPENPEPIDRE